MIRRGRQASTAQTVTPGSWIYVPIPGDPWPIEMQIGPHPRRRAFIHREADGSGGWQTLAAKRCPDLVPGTYTVKVYGAEEPIVTEITVI